MIGNLIRLTSGKFAVAAGTLFGLLGGDATGLEVSAEASIGAAIVAAAYIIAEAWVDCRRGEDGAGGK